MNDIYNSHPVDTLDVIQGAISRFKARRGRDPTHLVVPKWMLSSLKEMKGSNIPFDITAVCGVPVSSSEDTVVLESS